MKVLEDGLALSDGVSVLAIEPALEPLSPLSLVAKALATGQTVMPTVEIPRRLREQG